MPLFLSAVVSFMSDAFCVFFSFFLNDEMVILVPLLDFHDFLLYFKSAFELI